MICCFISNSHPNGGELVSHCDFDLYYCNDNSIIVSFHIHIGHLCISFGEMSFQVLCRFLLIFLFFLATPCSLEDLSFPAMD